VGLDQILFLTGLGVVYAVAFAVAGSVFVLWPAADLARIVLRQRSGRGHPAALRVHRGFRRRPGVVMVVVFWLGRCHHARQCAGHPGEAEPSPGSS